VWYIVVATVYGRPDVYCAVYYGVLWYIVVVVVYCGGCGGCRLRLRCVCGTTVRLSVVVVCSAIARGASVVDWLSMVDWL